MGQYESRACTRMRAAHEAGAARYTCIKDTYHIWLTFNATKQKYIDISSYMNAAYINFTAHYTFLGYIIKMAKRFKKRSICFKSYVGF